jgi:hypothetical protein
VEFNPNPLTMRALTQSEKRTIRFSAVVLSVYLVFFVGWRGWKHWEGARSDYQQLVLQAEQIGLQLQSYENKTLLMAKLKENFRMDLSNIPRAALVGQVSAAIQSAAQTGGIQLGPIRESPGRGSGEELAAMQLEGTGPVASIMQLLHRLETLGYPLIVDSIQIAPDQKPGMVKLTLHLVILDFERWKEGGKRDA